MSKPPFWPPSPRARPNRPLISRVRATELLGTMLGGYNIQPLIDLLDDAECAPAATKALSQTLLMFDYKHGVKEKADAGNALAQQVMKSWAEAEWFTGRRQTGGESHRHRVQGHR
jgi:aconitate hydratase 2/2-methylisocitrate dehydratase